MCTRHVYHDYQGLTAANQRVKLPEVAQSFGDDRSSLRDPTATWLQICD